MSNIINILSDEFMKPEARALAPVVNAKNVVVLMRAAVEERKLFEFRLTARTRKHASIDMFTVSHIVGVYDQLGDINKARMLDMTKGNPYKLAELTWKVIGKAEERKP